MVDSPKLERDFSFIKWFLSVATLMIAGFTAFLFNLTISNQASIREILIEVRNIKTADQRLVDDVDRIVERIDKLSTDPVHGWGQRWSRAEADRENSRQDKGIERLSTSVDRIRSIIEDIRIPLSKLEARAHTTESKLNGHVALPAHIDAGKALILLQTQVESILKKLEDDSYGVHMREREGN